MKLTVIGCGDAFGSGGRRQTSYLLESGSSRVLIDCGATTSMGFNALGLDPNAVGSIVISHLHGDHFGGLVWWLIHALYVGKRREPLAVWGPPGIEARFNAACDALFPGTRGVARTFDMRFHEMSEGKDLTIAGFAVSAFEVVHPSGAPSHALRFVDGKKVFAFTGDSEWTASLIEAGRGADLYMMECYRFAGVPTYHMSWESIRPNLDAIGAKRILLTHMSDEMLARAHEVEDARVTMAADGLVVEV